MRWKRPSFDAEKHCGRIQAKEGVWVVGITEVESNLGTALRTGVVLIMAWIMVFVQGKQAQVKTVPKNELGFTLWNYTDQAQTTRITSDDGQTIEVTVAPETATAARF